MNFRDVKSVKDLLKKSSLTGEEIDSEERISDLAYEIEKSDVDWRGMDASLETSLGEYATYFPDHTSIVISDSAGGGWVSTYSMSDFVTDVNDYWDEGVTSYADQSKEEVLKYKDIPSSVFTLDRYMGLIRQGNSHLNNKEFVDTILKRLNLR